MFVLLAEHLMHVENCGTSSDDDKPFANDAETPKFDLQSNIRDIAPS